MNSREAIKYIEENINAGKSKSTIYQELSSRIRYKSDLLSYMAICPDKDIKTRYKKINLVLFSLLIFILVIQILSSIYAFTHFKTENVGWFVLHGIFTHILVPFALMYLIIQVWKFRSIAYRFVIVCSMLTLIMSMEQYIQHQMILDWLVYAVPWIAAMSLSIVIMNKVFPYESLFRGLNKDKLEKELIKTEKTV